MAQLPVKDVSAHLKGLTKQPKLGKKAVESATVWDSKYQSEMMMEDCMFHEAKEVIMEDVTNPAGDLQTMFSEPHWDPRYTIGMFGSRGTGKSFGIRNVAAVCAPYYPWVYVFTETTMNCYWEQMTNPKFIIQGFNKTAIMEIFKLQEKKVRDWREGKWIGNPLALMIWDDCVPEDLYWDPVFRWMFFNGRHYYLGIWMNSQYFFRIPPGYRGNFDWVCSLAQDQGRQVEAFFAEMAFAVGICKRLLLVSFDKMFKDATIDRGIIIFHIRDKTLPIKDRIYKWKAEDPGIFWMGCMDYWRNNMNHLDLIVKGVARERAEKEIKYEEFGLIDPSEPEKNGGKKKREEGESAAGSNQRFLDPQDKFNAGAIAKFSDKKARGENSDEKRTFLGV